MSTGHGIDETVGETPSVSAVFGSASDAAAGASVTVDPVATAPGCHVTVARPSVVTTAPATPGCAVSDPATAGGIGAATIAEEVGAVADCEPPLPVAVTTSESVEPMSSGVSVYVVA